MEEFAMRYQFLLMVFIVCCATLLKGVEPAEVERIRKEKIEKSKELKFSPELLNWYVSRISNDDEPFTEEEVFQVFAKPASNENERFKHKAYIGVALFRWRDRGDAILRLFDVLTPTERFYLCTSCWAPPYEALLPPQSFPIWERMFLDGISIIKDNDMTVDQREISSFCIFQIFLGKALAVDREKTVAFLKPQCFPVFKQKILEHISSIGDSTVSNDQQNVILERAQSLLEMAFELDEEEAVALLKPQCFPVLKQKFTEQVPATSDSTATQDDRNAALNRAKMLLIMALMLDRGQAVALVENELRCRVSDDMVRVSFICIVLEYGGRPALPLAEWYFETYCTGFFDMHEVLDFLKKHVSEDELRGIVQKRRDNLKEIIDILDGKETQTTEPERPTADTTKEEK
jgi:hypothetical protein